MYFYKRSHDLFVTLIDVLGGLNIFLELPLVVLEIWNRIFSLLDYIAIPLTFVSRSHCNFVFMLKY